MSFFFFLVQAAIMSDEVSSKNKPCLTRFGDVSVLGHCLFLFFLKIFGLRMICAGWSLKHHHCFSQSVYTTITTKFIFDFWNHQFIGVLS